MAVLALILIWKIVTLILFIFAIVVIMEQVDNWLWKKGGKATRCAPPW